jgi:hypothetical protein
MLLSSRLQPECKKIMMGIREEVANKILVQNIREISPADYTEKRVVIKGCGDLPIPPEAYMEITGLLRPFAKSIMYGEPCSTVPVFKKKD